jgi:O-antigen/teichoic acid export membrane protein
LLKSSFIKNAIAYSGSNFVIQLVNFLRGIVVWRILPPEIMGFWNFMTVVQRFIATFDLGCIAGASRELPIMRGKQDPQEEARIRSTTMWFTLLQNIVISILASLYIWWNRANYVPWEIIAASVAIITFIITSFNLAYMTFFSGAQAFVPLSKVILVGSLFEGLLFPLGAYLWGLGGLMAMSILSTIFRAWLFFFSSQALQMSIHFKVFKDVLRRLLSFGFFLRVVDYPNALFSLASILWVTKFMTKEELALFSMSTAFFLQVTDLTTRVGVVYGMRFLEQGGSDTPREAMALQLKQYLFMQLLVAVPLLSWVAGVWLPFIVNSFIPKYSAAIPSILVLLMCNYFYVLNSGLTNPWILEKRLVARGIANLVGLLVMGLSLAVCWFLLDRRTITDLAYATLSGHFLYFLYMVIAVGKDMWQFHECAEVILTVTLAAGWTLFILQTGYNSLAQYGEFLAHLKNTLFMGGWTLVAILLVPAYGLKRSQLLTGLRT